MEGTKSRKRKKEDEEKEAVVYEYKNSWVEKMVERKRKYLQLERERGYDEDYLRKMYYWEYACISRSNVFAQDISSDDGLIWEYRLYARVETKTRLYKPILTVKQSKINDKVSGLFSNCRLFPGDAITVISESELAAVEKKKWNNLNGGDRLLLGGSCALNARYYLSDKCNAVVGPDGVVRAVYGIQIGEEILIDFELKKFHPAKLVDALVWTKSEGSKNNKRIMARVDSFKRDGNGGFKYLIKLRDGTMKEVVEEEFTNNYVTKAELSCA